MLLFPLMSARSKCPLQLMQHRLDPRFAVRLQNIVEGFDLEGLGSMFLVRGNKDDIGLDREPADILGQQHTIDGRNIDIQKNHIHFLRLQILQCVQTVLELSGNAYGAVCSDQKGKLLPCQHFILYNYRSHRCSFVTSK
ncbi:hypothetical protein D3C73_969810 [compost metagenome]